MGTELEIIFRASDRTAGQRVAESAFASVRRLDDVLSTWREDTQLARVNHAPVGSNQALSPALAELLGEVWRWWHDTDGTFDPAVGPLVDAWGIRTTLHRPSAAVLARARRASGLIHFQLDPVRGTITRLASGAWLDSGGFGKGAALRGVGAALWAAGIHSALVNFGGQVLALGSPPDAGEPGGWLIGVAHPARRDVAVRHLVLRDRSASTSGQSERPGHILDPRSGFPVPAWGSVTVVAADPMIADILSTALFVMGPDDGLRWAQGRSDVGALFLIPRGGRVEARWNRAMEPFLKETQ